MSDTKMKSQQIMQNSPINYICQQQQQEVDLLNNNKHLIQYTITTIKLILHVFNLNFNFIFKIKRETERIKS